jgi:hypothetical protein
VFSPDYAPEEIAEIAAKLRKDAGFPKEPSGLVADLTGRTRSAARKSSSGTSRKSARTRRSSTARAKK